MSHFLHGEGDFAAHQRTRQDQRDRARQARHRAYGVGQVLLAHDGDRVDADLLAADIVAVRLGDSAQRHLAHLGAATYDDDALAEDFEHARHALDATDDLERFQVGD